MKIVSSGRVLNSREFYEKKKRRNRIRLVLFFILLVSITLFIVYFSRQDKFQITEVEILGENIIDKEEIIQSVQHLLAGHYLWFIPRSNIFIYPRHSIKEILVEAFPRFKSVNLNLDANKKLLIIVDERIPFALYCAGASSPQTASDCFFLDKEGFIFAPAPSFSDGVYFVYVTEDMVENPLGQRLMSDEEFNSLLSFLEKLIILDIHPSMLEIGNDEYTLILPSNAKIIWRKESGLTVVYSNLEAFLANDSIRAQKNFFKKILYLDLRTEDKVFYKFRD